MSEEEISYSYETLWKLIIRPPRDDYTDSLLGTKLFTYRSRKYHRKDYEIMSTQGYILKCSFIEPVPQDRPSVEMPVVLYLHGNSSSRIEGLYYTGELLKRHINLFVVDLAGCGQSEGEYISLGYHESHDIENIINFIEKLPGVGRIGMWGRSMGAATTMIYAHRDPRVKAICLDSPFADFNKLAKELVGQKINLPGFLISGILSIVRGTIINKNGLDINRLKPIEQAEKTFQPAIFIHAIHDELINVQHSIELFNAYGGQQKSLKCCDTGGHNTKRDKKIIKEVMEFFKKYLVDGYEEKIEDDNIINKEEKDINKVDSFGSDMKNDDDNMFYEKSHEIMEYNKKQDQFNQSQIDGFKNLFQHVKEPDIKKSIFNFENQQKSQGNFNNSGFNNFNNYNICNNNYNNINEQNNLLNIDNNKKLK